MKYTIFSSYTIKELAYLVNELLDDDDGWVCHGGVSVCQNMFSENLEFIYAQAMIKED